MDKDKTLEELYNTLVYELLRRIKMGEATASDLSVARQLLKDSNVDSAVSNEDSPLYDLIDNLPFDEEAQ